MNFAGAVQMIDAAIVIVAMLLVLSIVGYLFEDIPESVEQARAGASSGSFFSLALASYDDINSLKADYSIYSKDVNAKASLLLKGQDTVIESKASGVPSIRAYALGGNTFYCAVLLGGWNCFREDFFGRDVPFDVSKKQEVAFYRQLLENNVISFKGEPIEKNVLGNACKELEMSIAVQSLSLEEKQKLLYFSGFADIANPGDYIAGLNYFNRKACFDYNGIALEDFVEFGFSENGLLALEKKVSSYDVNPELSADLFKLP